MTRIGLDTNVVVSFLTDRDPEQQARAATLIRDATRGRHLVVVHQTVILETVYVLHNLYGVSPAVVSASMRDLLALPGVVTACRLDLSALWRTWPHRLDDFGDACLAVGADTESLDRLATFDAAFAERARQLGIESAW